MDDKLHPGIRMLAGLAGFVIGGFAGFWAMVLVIIFSGESLGVRSIVPGVLVVGCIGFVTGLLCPRLIARIVARVGV